MRYLFFILMIGSFQLSYSQTINKIKKIVELQNGSDTISIQQFDSDGHLIFWKHFPTEYGISQILTYTYNNGKLMNYTWSHSNAGFVISDYLYDTISNIRLTYQYENKTNNSKGLKHLTEINNDIELKNTKEYKSLHYVTNKYKSEIEYYRDTFLVKKIELNQNGDTTSKTDYKYLNGKLKSEKKKAKWIGREQEIVYSYDSLGNELGWVKIYDNKDTSVMFKNTYKDKQLETESEFSHGELRTIRKFEYKDSKLINEKYYNSSDKLERLINYVYDSYNNLVKKIDNYYSMNQLKVIEYKYEKY